jgi:DNA-binding beta-propeller fold protein YncE/mono/diheme cytochrome c family protein
VLVTIRDPGLLLILRELPDGGLEEEARIDLPADAWGLALTQDERTVVVTSAWTHKVTGVDLDAKKPRWSLDVAREPRGVVVHPTTNVAYVTHLTGSDLTRIDGVGSAEATAKPVPLPPSPALTPLGSKLSATLGYALTFDDGGKRLLVARHAQGGLGQQRWAGAPTIDVLQTETDEPLLAPRIPAKILAAAPRFLGLRNEMSGENTPSYLKVKFQGSENQGALAAQPRAMAVARKAGLVWVASEGEDVVQAFDLRSPAPALALRRAVRVGDKYNNDPKIIGGHFTTIATHCGAPSGLALSPDETQLYVFCRSTYDVAVVELDRKDETSRWSSDKSSVVTIGRLADDPLGAEGSRGRRLFYGAKDGYSSGGLACSGCHPEGRDDGHVWHEVTSTTSRSGTRFFLAHQNLAEKTNGGRLGHPRQTPMLVGRVDAAGPYGWQAQSKNLTERLAEGFMLHRWEPWEPVDPNHWMTGVRANALTVFLRKGLVAPPKLQRPLSEQEERGKKIFESPSSECATCHVPATGFTNRVAYKIGLGAPLPGFEEEPDALFKTPSLLHLAGSAPFFHDGRVETLDALVHQNNDRMGKTNHLSAEDKKALVAYLETL